MQINKVNETDTTILRHINAWEKKSSLRLVYKKDIYEKIENYMLSGNTLELGVGAGFFKKNHTGVISSDILFLEHLDIVCNSHFLAFQDASLMNIIGVDVLHHFKEPYLFFNECKRVLKPKGRLILIEPWISALSKFVYTYLHHEDCRFVKNPLDYPFGNSKNPWQGNAMIPYQIFDNCYINKFKSRWPNFKILTVRPFSFLAYPSTGGFKPYGVKSKKIISLLLKIEHAFEPIFLNIAAFRSLIVIENGQD